MDEVPIDRMSNASMSFDRRSLSMGRMSSRVSSRRDSPSVDRVLDSMNLARNFSDRIMGALDSSWIAQVGDSGDRVLADGNADDNESMRASEVGVSVIPDEALILSNGFWSRGGAVSPSPVSAPVEEIVSPLPTDAILHSSEKDQIVTGTGKDMHESLPRSLDYISYVIHLAVFGEFGVFTRYLLQKLFGPDLLSLTNDETPLYLDLPANMLGSFLMGWFGVVLKSDIRNLLSDQMVVGLTTGYLGSLTTFSGWNQKMLNLSSRGHWVFAIAGIILGILLVNESIRVGVESSEALRRILVQKLNQESARIRCYLEYCVWMRWYLARLNGQGIGRKEYLKWLPFGTLLANVLAACLMAALATISKAVNTKSCGIIVSGVQFGFLGCLSTVSTFVAEVYAMRQSGHSGRAFLYVAVTIFTSFIMGTLIYSVPVWVKNYK